MSLRRPDPRSRRRALVAAALLVATGLSGPALAERTAPRSTYIVTVAGRAPDSVAAVTTALGGRVGFVYQHAMTGFSVTLRTDLLPALRQLPGVVAVQPDQRLHADATQTPTPSYGLDRINARTGLDNRYTYSSTGAGVTAYVIDSGINATHSDFGKRAVRGFDAVSPSTGAVDCYGHGTHVAGTIGGKQYGVAKAVTLVAVRVLDCDGNGDDAGVIAGIDWVVAHAHRPAVANMSLGGAADDGLDRAVNGLIAHGIAVGVAAGNDGSFLNDLLGQSDACYGSPARVPNALTVAATDRGDARAGYSDRGSCVDLWAPGTDITSDWIGHDYATNTLSGTSMATPHVVGVAALYLAGHRTATPAQLATAILGSATPDVVSNAGNGTPNRLLYAHY